MASTSTSTSESLTSPGRALSGRWRLEDKKQRSAAWALTRFLAQARVLPVDATLPAALEALWSTFAGRLPAVSLVPGEVAESMLAVMSAAQREGWSRTRTARQMKVALGADSGVARLLVTGPDEPSEVVPEGRAWRAAVERQIRTEATSDFASLRLVELAEAGFALKRWVAHHDRFTRPTHLRADGQTVPLSRSFEVGMDLLSVPGDPMGSAREVENCRCVLVGVRS